VGSREAEGVVNMLYICRKAPCCCPAAAGLRAYRGGRRLFGRF
jgi:hypothetical protein